MDHVFTDPDSSYFLASATLTTRMHAALLTSTRLTMRSVQPADLATLALIVYPIWRARAAALWVLAAERADDKTHECKSYVKLALSAMTVEDAVERLSTGVFIKEGEYSSPMEILARGLVLESVRAEAEKVFMRDVLGEDVDLEEDVDEETVEREVKKDDDEITPNTPRAHTPLKMSHALLSAGRSLGGRTSQLVHTYEEVCVVGNVNNVASTLDNVTPTADLDLTSRAISDVIALVHAIALYRLIFTSSSGSSALPRVPSFTLLSSARSDPNPASPTTPKASLSSLKPARVSLSAAAYSTLSMPSPPPSPPLNKPSAQRLALRRCLDSAAFDRRALLEDARDRVVDLVTG